MGVHMGMLRRKGAADTESCWHLMASTFRAGPRCPIQASPGHRALFPVDLTRLAHRTAPLATSCRAAGKALCSASFTRSASVASVSPTFTGTASWKMMAPASTSSCNGNSQRSGVAREGRAPGIPRLPQDLWGYRELGFGLVGEGRAGAGTDLGLGRVQRKRGGRQNTREQQSCFRKPR